jgi:hypothetical protein
MKGFAVARGIVANDLVLIQREEVRLRRRSVQQ